MFLSVYASSMISYFMVNLAMFKNSYQHLKIENNFPLPQTWLF